MKDKQFFWQGVRGCLITFVIIAFAIFAMAISTTYQYPEHPSCGGMLGAGYPVLFICDDWGGGSPTNSWGKITSVDIINGGIRPTCFLIDFLFYSGIIWIILLSTARIFQKWISCTDLWWVAFISFGFLVGFLCAFLTFRSSRLYLGDHYYYTSPTPIIPSPTALGTMPSVITPISTPTP